MSTLRGFALRALEGVGDAGLGEWEKWTGRAFHVCRRLSTTESVSIGPAIDIRGTPEAVRRLKRVLPYASRSPQGLAVLSAELAGAET